MVASKCSWIFSGTVDEGAYDATGDFGSGGAGFEPDLKGGFGSAEAADRTRRRPRRLFLRPDEATAISVSKAEVKVERAPSG